MELKRRFSFRRLALVIYISAFAVYMLVGLNPAFAKTYEISGGLVIPEINLITGVTTLELKNHKLDTPDTIVGSYSRNKNKTFLIGHSTTVFKKLKQVRVDDYIYYNNDTYKIVEIKTLPKSEVDMTEILAEADQETVVMMTCAGEILPNQDATHRLIVTALKQ